MTDGEINSILFRGVIVNLNNLFDGQGNRLNESNMPQEFGFGLAFQQRPDSGFNHNYERDKFLHNRDKYITVELQGRYWVLLRCHENEHMQFYKKPLSMMFPDNVENANHVFKNLLSKFYDDVSSAEVSDVQQVDFSTGIHPSQIRIQRESF